MACNIEIKARVADAEALKARVAELADEGPWRIEQHDIFFNCAQARLKLRCFDNGEGELIFYRRVDTAGPKASEYERSPVADPNSLRRVLERANGLRGEVIKTRTLYLVGRTRIHLDHVAGLGEYMELEVVLAPEEASETGEAEARQLMQQLEIEPNALVDGAYIDLIEAGERATGG
ncbi:class IV adenylate cyclase [uncultured Salinisphaera sp.]|uniref:class IV adenylate cyclase n=1 Tax=uncultured Salinisphaera sp. TaxID=359372 RepID=UPI0032B2AA56